MNELLTQPAVKIVLHFLQATPAVPILFVLMFFDVLTGFAAALITKKLDSSVSWKGIQQMRRYRGSQIWGADGCYGYW